MNSFSCCAWDTAFADDVPELAPTLARHEPGAVAIVTCQRLEIYQHASCDCPAPIHRRGLAAAQHIAEVAAGLHSVVLGEDQVLGQVRDAWSQAPRGDMHRIGSTAIGAARQLRKRRRLSADTGQLLDRALANAGVPACGSIAVLGTGILGRRVVARAHELGFSQVTLAGRTPPPDVRPGTTWAHISELESLPAPDVLVACLGEGAPRLSPDEHLPRVSRLIVDLGTPRNIHGPAAVPVVTIADLMPTAGPAIDPCRADLRSELHDLLDARLQPILGPGSRTVGQLREHVEGLRQTESARIRRLHPEIAPETIDLITRSLINRVFH
ncbi:MAG: hypothetical protein WED87_07750, partial [Dehalococcoidia bacterium]